MSQTASGLRALSLQLRQRKQRAKHSETKQVLPFGSLEDEALLAFVDKHSMQKVLNPFDVLGDKFDAILISEKIAIDRMVELYPGPVALRSVSILEALVYKMSAPYRHAKFWRFSRRVLKEVKKLNTVEVVDYLKDISQKMLQSEMRYGLNIGAVRYLAAVMISKAVRICRLRKFCEQAAFHCLQHLETGHLLESNLLLLALNADIHAAVEEQMTEIVKCYECLLPLITDSSLLSAKGLLDTAKDSFGTSSFPVSSLNSFHPIAQMCGFDETEYADLLASSLLNGKQEKERSLKMLTMGQKHGRNFGSELTVTSADIFKRYVTSELSGYNDSPPKDCPAVSFVRHQYLKKRKMNKKKCATLFAASKAKSKNSNVIVAR